MPGLPARTIIYLSVGFAALAALVMRLTDDVATGILLAPVLLFAVVAIAGIAHILHRIGTTTRNRSVHKNDDRARSDKDRL